jgi:hypothetical protein
MTRNWISQVVVSFTATFLLSFPTGVVAQATPERSQIQVDLPVVKSKAFDRVMAAFVDEGLTIATASQDGGLIVAEPITFERMTVKGQAIIRATVIGLDTASKVVLSARWNTIRGLMQERRDANSEDPGQPVTSRMTSELGKVWARLERIAAALSK